MYWVLGVAALGVLAWLTSEEKAAYQAHQANQERLAKQRQQRQQQYQALRQDSALAADFYRHLKLYQASIATADASHALYLEHKQLVQMVANREQQLIQQLIGLKQQRDNLPYPQQTAIRQQINQLRQFIQQARDQKHQLIHERQQLLEQVRAFNAHTNELKTYIGQHCGKRGRIWYQNKSQSRMLHG